MDSIEHIKSFISPDVALYYYNQLMDKIRPKMYHLKLHNGTDLKSRLVYHYNDNIEEIETLKALVEERTGLVVDNIFINLFRPRSKDYLPYHTDTYDYKTVFTISLGDNNSSRNIRFRSRSNHKNAKSFYQEPGDAHSFPLTLNEEYEHGIPTKNIKLSGRMSVVFFCSDNQMNMGMEDLLNAIGNNQMFIGDDETRQIMMLLGLK